MLYCGLFCCKRLSGLFNLLLQVLATKLFLNSLIQAKVLHGAFLLEKVLLVILFLTLQGFESGYFCHPRTSFVLVLTDDFYPKIELLIVGVLHGIVSLNSKLS